MAVIRDYCPDLPIVQHLQTDELTPRSLSFSRLSDSNRQLLAVELAHSIPIPISIKKVIFGAYRLWLNRGRA